MKVAHMEKQNPLTTLPLNLLYLSPLLASNAKKKPKVPTGEQKLLCQVPGSVE
jgi:hypothetical protein